MRPIRGLSAAFLLASLAMPARADLPPPTPAPGPGPAPAQCNVASTQAPGEQCVECAASYEQPDKCQRELASQGFAQRCRASGASVWHEVWCRSGSAGPVTEKKRGCGSCSVGAADDGMALGIMASALLGLLLVARRRRH